MSSTIIHATTAIILHIIVWTTFPFFAVVALAAGIARVSADAVMALLSHVVGAYEACLKVADRHWARARGRA